MKLLWNRNWLDVPGYHVSGSGVLLSVEGALPLWRISDAPARHVRRPNRKVLVFLLTEGPRSTFRKARTKHQEPHFTGDYWVSVIAGRTLTTGTPVVALALRVPPLAEQLVLHPGLIHELDEWDAQEALEALRTALLPAQTTLAPLARQNYLHSAMAPPDELLECWARALTRVGLCKPKRTASAGHFSHMARRPPSTDDGSLLHTQGVEPVHPRVAESILPADTMRLFARRRGVATRSAAVLGAGDHARTQIIPALRSAGFSLAIVADRDPQIAALVAERYGFGAATTDPSRAIAELPSGSLVVVATAHDSHATLASQATEAGHRVFLEKPPAVTPSDVTLLASAIRTQPGMVEVGFNRRYHPLLRRAKSVLASEQGPLSIVCSIKQLGFNTDHWYFWRNQGTRFTGNLCHWIDLAVWLMDDRPLPVSVTLSPRVHNRAVDEDERVLTVTFGDGSVLTILGTTRGDDIRGVQEQIQIYRGNTTIIIDDIWKMRIRHDGFQRYHRTAFRHKGHTPMYREALQRARLGEPAKYPVRDVIMVSAIQIAASELVHQDQQAGQIPSWMAVLLDPMPTPARLPRASEHVLSR